MSAKRSGAGEARWRALIAEQERGGEGVARFAERRGLCAATMYWWRSRLRRGQDESVKLAAVEIVASPVSRESVSGSHFEIECRGGRRVRVPSGFDERELTRLMAALERSC